MKPKMLLVAVAFAACGAPAAEPTPGVLESSGQEAELITVANSILAAARDLDADEFSSRFSDQPGFFYLINTRSLTSREAVRAAFQAMLSRQRSFDVRWTEQDVQMLTADIGVFTGRFHTQATTMEGEDWEVSGAVTFVAVREPSGWRIVNWHTSE